MQWGPPEQQPFDANGYLHELAAFLSARSGGGPAVLWTDHEPSTVEGPFATDSAAEFAARLSALLGRTVRVLSEGAGSQSAVRVRQAEADALVLQHSAATVVLAGAPAVQSDGRAGRAWQIPLAVRLLGGQVLFLPRHSVYGLWPGRGSRHTVLQISLRCDGIGAPRRTGCESAFG